MNDHLNNGSNGNPLNSSNLQLTTIVIHLVLHKGRKVIGLNFPINLKLQSILQIEADAKWSNTLRIWYIPYNKDAYKKLLTAIEGKATIVKETDSQETNTPEITSKESISQPTKPNQSADRFLKPVSTATAVNTPNIVSIENQEALRMMKEKLVLKGYSPNTLRTYMSEMMVFTSTLSKVAAHSLTTERVKDYLLYCHVQLNLSENTIHSRMNALKFYYEQVLGREKFFWEIPRPKKPYLLPNFFNQDEIVAILNGTVNIKHKAMLMLAYSSGLRVSEVIAIKTYNIDSKRMCIKIEQAKGKKDRMVALSPVLLVMLREYCKEFMPKKDGYLFEGQNEGLPYGIRSLQEVLTAAKQRAGILKPGSIHALRHSFATHLVDRGTDVTIIQKLMGHNDLKTTMRYLHISNKDLLKIISPLDNLILE